MVPLPPAGHRSWGGRKLGRVSGYQYQPPVGYPAAAPQPSSTGRTVRAIVAWVALAVAALLTAPAVVAYWAHTTVANQQAYVAAVAPVATDPAVKQVVAQQVGEAVTKNLKLGALNQAIGAVVEQLAVQAMGTDAYRQAWDKANAAVQQQIVAALAGQPSGVSVSGEDAVLDASVLVEAIKSGLVSQGLGIAANLEVPPGQLQIRLMDAATLSRLQTLYRISSPFGGWGVYAVGALYLLALLLAPKRGPVLLASGIAIAVGGLLVAGVISLGEAAFRSQLAGQPLAPAAGTYAKALFAPLTSWPAILIGVGAILAIVGLLWWVVAARRPSR